MYFYFFTFSANLIFTWGYFPSSGYWNTEIYSKYSSSYCINIVIICIAFNVNTTYVWVGLYAHLRTESLLQQNKWIDRKNRFAERNPTRTESIKWQNTRNVGPPQFNLLVTVNVDVWLFLSRQMMTLN